MERQDQQLAYIQDRLSNAERSAFEAEMAGDPGLAAETAVMRAARAEIGREAPLADRADGWARLDAAITSESAAPANDNRRPWRMVAQAASVAIASIALWQFAVVPRLGGDTGAQYQTASEAADGPALQVIFARSAPVGEIAALLGELEGTITDGPGSLGVFHIAFPDDALRDAAAQRLAARTDLVEQVFAQ